MVCLGARFLAEETSVLGVEGGFLIVLVFVFVVVIKPPSPRTAFTAEYLALKYCSC